MKNERTLIDMSLIQSYSYNLKTNIASLKVTNKYNSHGTFSIIPANERGV